MRISWSLILRRRVDLAARGCASLLVVLCLKLEDWGKADWDGAPGFAVVGGGRATPGIQLDAGHVIMFNDPPTSTLHRPVGVFGVVMITVHEGRP